MAKVISSLSGSTGLTGAKGDKGDIGLTGVAGTNGLDGAKGDKGDQGIQGIQGLKGDTGAKGDTGSFNGDITADQVTETATRKFQTPTQSAYNDATSSIQQQIDSKQSTLVSGTTIKTIEGQSILGSGNIDITKSDVGLPLADNTSDASKSVLSSTKLTTPRSINGVNFDGTSNITINAVDSTPRIAVSEKAQANGVATLGSDGKVPNNQIPALAISETFPVSSQAQMLALSQADQGDVAIRSDISKSFILRVSPSSVLANWSELLTPTGAVTSVNGQVGVVTLSKSDVGLSNVDNTSDANKPVSNATQTAINAADAGNVKLTGNQTITGTKFFDNLATTASSIVIDANSGGGGSGAILINNREQNFGLRITQTRSNATSAGIFVGNSGISQNIISGQTSTGTGFNYVGQNNGVNTFTVDKLGATTATSFIKSSTPATNILLAGGGDIAQNTAFNKNFGTTAGTVVEGGTLGSNAYTSTAYSPLTGGAGYIQNQNASAQSANMWISGAYMSTYNADGYNIELDKTGGFGSSLALRNSSLSSNSLLRMFKPNNTDFYDLYTSSTGIGFSGTVTATSFNGSATLTGIPTAPTAPAGTNTTQIATTAFVLANSSARPYKVYTALISQSNTDAPVTIVLENTIGNIVWTRANTGQYLGTLTGAFTLDKTVCFTGGNTNNDNIHHTTQRNNGSSVVIETYNSGAKADYLLAKTSIEIRVYN